MTTPTHMETDSRVLEEVTNLYDSRSQGMRKPFSVDDEITTARIPFFRRRSRKSDREQKCLKDERTI